MRSMPPAAHAFVTEQKNRLHPALSCVIVSPGRMSRLVLVTACALLAIGVLPVSASTIPKEFDAPNESGSAPGDDDDPLSLGLPDAPDAITSTRRVEPQSIANEAFEGVPRLSVRSSFAAAVAWWFDVLRQGRPKNRRVDQAK